MKQAARAPKHWICQSTQLWPNPCGGVSTYYNAAVQPLVQAPPSYMPAGLVPLRTARLQSPNQQASGAMLDVQLANLMPNSTQQQPVCTPTELQGFNDPQLAFSAKSTQQLLQSLAIFKACSIKPLVQNADTLMAAASKVLGTPFVSSVVRHTLYRQFCGGECEASTQHKAELMRVNGIQPILHSAAESDVSSSSSLALSAEEMSERGSEHNLQSFLKSIDLGRRAGGKPFTQAKITALGNCDVLKEATVHLLKGGRISGHHIEELNTFMAEHLSQPQLQQFDSMMQRIDTMCAAAQQLSHLLSWLDMHYMSSLLNSLQQAKVGVLVDAEYSYIQPALDAIILHMQAKYNRGSATVFNTYQCYLKDAHPRILADMQQARQAGFVWAGKLVRGAYIHMERQRAVQLGYSCPIQDTLQDTHDNYNRCVEEVMRRVQAEQFEMMVASHNQASVEQAVALMQRLGMHPASPRVHFGQLQGMADHLTYTLGAHGYQAYKAVPYGPVEETIAYLVRRAKENSDVLGGVGKETVMLKAELWRRLKNKNAVARWLKKEPMQAAYPAAA